jgi:hypothetical protein
MLSRTIIMQNTYYHAHTFIIVAMTTVFTISVIISSRCVIVTPISTIVITDVVTHCNDIIIGGILIVLELSAPTYTATAAPAATAH